MGAITDISERYVEEITKLDPVRAYRMIGTVPDPSLLTDYSPTGSAAIAELQHRTVAALRDAVPSDEAERVGRLYLLDAAASDAALADAGEYERRVSILAAPPSGVRVSFDLMPKESAEDWSVIAERLGNVGACLASYRASLRAGLDAGRVAPGVNAEAMAEQCATFAAGWFSTFVSAYGEGPLRARLDGAAASASAAYATTADWVRTTYLPKATDDIGAGEERYRLWGAYMLGVELDLDETYAWGWAELERIEREQAAECDRIRSGATYDEVRALLDADPGGSLPDIDAYRHWLQEITDAAIDRLDGWQFDIDRRIRRCEIGIPPEGAAAAAYYTRPSQDLTRPGRTWFPRAGRTTFPKWDQVTIAYHEAVPGHHLQVGTALLQPLTRAHRSGFQSAHGEGWALYAERLMDELGLFETPAERLGFLASQAFRAARVVVDIGIHTGRPRPDGSRWTVAAAVEQLIKAGVTRPFAESEVLRYISWPTQSTTYKLGERAWLAGRDAARAQQGSSFDLKRWHAGALAMGALGLADLERELVSAGTP